MDNKKILKFGLLAAVALIVLFTITVLTDDTRGYRKVDTSVAIAQLNDSNVAKARLDDREQRLQLTLKKGVDVDGDHGVEKITTQYPARATNDIFTKLEKAKPESFTTKVTKDSFLMSMLSMMLPIIVIAGVLMFMMSRLQGGGMGMFGFGGSRAKELTKDMPTNTFDDVAGADEAVDELHEIKDFLQDPSAYEALGAKIPRGVLLYGPPGTGKTLLARAVAGEAGVPFYSISGSDFVEMFVGVGASRVRDLFKQAKENSPCIIFVDEIDAVGRQRGSGMGGGHDEREQTLNQLLVEMDGFGDRQGVILIAATNRPDILDPALLRPGRFDRQIPVTNPDLAGREQILRVHAKGKPFAPDADMKALAKRTAGMSGADLANVLNEAALLTARIGGNVITADALEEATDRVVGGPRRSSKIISEYEKKVTAYHEGGHTLAAWAMKDIDRVYKVTILARGKTGGHAMTAGDDDKGMYNRSELFARLVFALGGRAAEELVFGQPTTGASSDIENATKIARAMVTEYGMSPTLGCVKYGEEDGDPFTRGSGGGVIEVSQAVAATIDAQVQALLAKAHREAYEILATHRDYLDRLAAKLLEKETLRRPDLEALFGDLPPRERLEVFDNEDADFPMQGGRTPVKTPTEVALERGEQPPKRFSIVEASRAARARRQQQRELADAAAGAATVPAAGEPALRFAGSTPPAGWQVPGDSAPGTSGAHAAPGGQLPAGWQVPGDGVAGPSSEPVPSVPAEQHPQGATGFQFGADLVGDIAENNPATRPAAQQLNSHGESWRGDADAQALIAEGNDGMIGFRLPEHERPERPEADGWGAGLSPAPQPPHTGTTGGHAAPVDPHPAADPDAARTAPEQSPHPGAPGTTGRHSIDNITRNNEQ